jgi:NADP-dependent 3-hydroxy acid dehydrogenase YdfG
VTDYQSVLDLFENTFKKYKRIDHVVVTAGSTETEAPWFDHALNLSEVRKVSRNATLIDFLSDHPSGTLSEGH